MARSIRPRHCAALRKRCIMMRSNRPRAAAAPPRWFANHTPTRSTRASFWRARGARERAICEPLRRRA
eukprot:10009929-Lingulodinium_polyedra.AAC.1